MKMKKIVVCASGRGTNFLSVIEAQKKGELPIQILGLISDKAEAKVIEIAKENKIPAYPLAYSTFSDKNKFHQAFSEALIKLQPELILTLGYMRIIPSFIVKRFKDKIINIHPSLLPSFPGLNAQRQALDYGCRWTGATTHFIDEGVDLWSLLLLKKLFLYKMVTQKNLYRKEYLIEKISSL